MPSESYKSRDGKSYPLWINIDEVMDAVMPAYWSKLRERRHERGWIFRGHGSDAWDMIPALYRPPGSPEIIEKRRAYTEEFIYALEKNADRLILKDLYKDKLLAIAQHYGFYTPFLDFTYNIETAAYFATKNINAKIGVIYGFNLKEYNEMRNPFDVWGIKQQETDNIFKEHGMATLPPIISTVVEFNDVPRIYQQEGLFAKLEIDKIDIFMNECIDRFYFYQQNRNEYVGKHKAWEHLFPSKNMFDSAATYQAFIEMARKQKPALFDETPEFSEKKLFPSSDPILEFAQSWKNDNPDPFQSNYKKTKSHFIFETNSKIGDIDFKSMVNSFYFDPSRKTPYQANATRNGRKLIERMCQYNDLNRLDNLNWLTYELLSIFDETKEYRCTLRLGNDSAGSEEKGQFYFILMERWLESNYRFKIDFKAIKKGWWCGNFDKIGWHNILADSLSVQNKSLMESKSNEIKIGNPYSPSDSVKNILSDFLNGMQYFSVGEKGSCLFDIQTLIIKEIGRQLTIGLGLERTSTCNMNTPLVHPDHDFSQPQFIVEIYDGFFQKYKRVCLCSMHWHHLGECDLNMLDNREHVRVGLA